MMTEIKRPAVAPTEVQPKAQRRTYPAAYKARILAEADACTEPGQIGALLRREGLYSSHLTSWRAARGRGALSGLEPKPRGPLPRVADERDQQLVEQARELERWRARAERAEALVDLQKKVAAWLGSPIETRSERP